MPQEKPNVKKPSLPSLKQQLQAEADEWMRKLFGLTKNWRGHSNFILNNYELGLRHMRLGNTTDAVMRFKIVTWLDPKHGEGWYQLGRAYLADNKIPSARRAFRKALLLRPGNEEIIYMMAVAGGKSTPVGNLPKRTPLALSLRYFDDIAPYYTQQQLDMLGYRGHELLTDALRASLAPGRVDHAVLEIGVGTGLCGPLLRDVAANLTGVDFSGEMMIEAMALADEDGRKTYDALVKRELHEFLREAPAEAYDAVLACGVVSYVGDMQPMCEQVARVLKPGGLFAFTADRLDGPDFRFDAEIVRFRFSESYLQALAAHYGLTPVKMEEGPVYPAFPMWVCVFSKGQAG